MSLQSLGQFALEAPRAANATQLGAQLEALIRPLGATRYACLFLHRKDEELEIFKTLSNLPRHWQMLYLERGYDADDPVFQCAVHGGAFGFWSELTRSARLDRKAREVMDFARDEAMTQGFTKRVSMDNGGMAVAMFSGERVDDSDEARAVFRTAADLFANEGARMVRPPRVSDPDLRIRKLSAMQLKVLTMRAEGLTNAAIAAKIQREPKTVETHASHVLKKLGVRNMNEAIRVAARIGLIA
jgi:DNA-binding CsgD family transcriptional regulator